MEKEGSNVDHLYQINNEFYVYIILVFYVLDTNAFEVLLYLI